MDEETLLLLQRSNELLEESRKVHQEADQIRRKLIILDFEAADVIERSEQRIKKSKQITDSILTHHRI